MLRAVIPLSVVYVACCPHLRRAVSDTFIVAAMTFYDLRREPAVSRGHTC
jgi:hypothetical protein